MDLKDAIPLIKNSTMSKGCWVIKDKFKFAVDAEEKNLNITYLKSKIRSIFLLNNPFNQNSVNVWKN